MRWLKRDIWKVGIAIVSMLLLLVLMVWVPVSAAGAYKGASGTVTVQVTPTEDATVTALNKEKLQHENDWWWSYGAVILSSVLSTFVLVCGALIGFWQWRMNRNDISIKELKDRQEAQEKELRDREDARRKEIEAQDKELRDRAEERFKTTVTALGDEKESTQIGGAILLRSFLNKDDEKVYKRYYTQIFDLAVAYLRRSNTSRPSEDPNVSLPLTPLRRALIDVFKEAFPLARDTKTPFTPRSLNATRVQLDGAYLAHADLSHAWMREASLRGAWITDANLYKADLREANLTQAYLTDTSLENAFCRKARFEGAQLLRARLTGADLSATNLTGANLSGADLSLRGSKSGRYPRSADLRGADLTEANLEMAQSLKGTDLRWVKGLTKDQLEACKAKDAIIDEDITTSSSQPPISSSLPLQSNDVQAPPTPSAQASNPTPRADGSSATSSEPGSQS